MFNCHLLEDSFDHEIGLLEMSLPRIRAIGKADHVGERSIMLVSGEPFLLEPRTNILRDLGLAPRQTLDVTARQGVRVNEKGTEDGSRCLQYS